MKRFHPATVLSVVLFCSLLTACKPDNQPPNEPGPGTGVTAAQSDPGCPAPITISTGLGNNQVGVVFLAAQGIGLGSQRAKLVSEFNARASEAGFRYCLAGGCLCEYKPSNDQHIQFMNRDVSGFTEVTILGTGGQPEILPQGTVKRVGLIVPPSPNVICRMPPPLPPRPVTSPGVGTTTSPSLPTDKPPSPSVECVQPTFSKPAGTVVVEKRFPFSPIDPGAANNALTNYVANDLQNDIDAVLQQWKAQIDQQCRQANPGGRCEGAFEPEPTLKSQSGDSGVGGQLFLVYRVLLAADIRGKCVPR